MRKLATAAAVSLALASGGAFGLGLGDIEMRSALNQPMNAEIRLTSVKPGELEGMIVQLASADAFSRAGIDRSQALTDLRFSVDQSSGVPVIRITSARPVVEPFLNFLLEVDWPQGRMVREYTVLLDPPVFMSSNASSRNATGDTPAVVQRGEQAIVAPTPIERDGNLAVAESFEVEVVAGSAEVTDSQIVQTAAADGDLVSLDGLADTAGTAIDDSEGELVSLTDLDAPNTDAVAERAADAQRAAADISGEVVDLNAELTGNAGAALDDTLFDVELVGGAAEVSDDFVVEGLAVDTGATDAGDAGDSEIVSLDGLDGDGAVTELTDVTEAGSDVTVQRGDTLYTIAENAAGDNVSVQQMMMALLQANESAFINGNINLVKAGAILRVPTSGDAGRLSQAQAVAAVGEQNQLWQEYRDQLRGTSQATRLASTDEAADSGSSAASTGDAGTGSDAAGELAETTPGATDSAGDDAATGNAATGEELRIVASNETSASGASATSGEESSGDAARLGEINRKLQLAREELAATRAQTGDLGEQAAELQSTSENLDALVTLRQNEVARFESELTRLREQDNVAENAIDTTTAAAADAANEATELASNATDAVADAGSTAADAAGDVAASAGDVMENAVDEASEAGTNALTAAGQTLEEVELLDEAEPEVAVDEVEVAAPAANEPWYQKLLSDPKSLAIAGVGGLGLLGLLGTLLFRRKRGNDSRLDFNDEVEFIDDDEAADLQSEVDAQVDVHGGAVAQPGFDADGVEIDGDGNRLSGAAAAGLAGAGAVGAATLGSLRGDGDDVDESPGFDDSLAMGSETQAIEDELGDDGIDKDDTISEADVYLAYGLHGQAEELLGKAIERKPDNPEYAQKLLQTYHAQGNAEGFHRTASGFHNRFDGDANPAWPAIAAMGQELRPNDPLYASGVGELSRVSEGYQKGEQLGDDDFLPANDSSGGGSISRDFGASGEPLDFDGADESALMDQSLDPAFAFDEGDLEATGDFSQIANELSSDDDGSLDFPSLDGLDGELDDKLGADLSDGVSGAGKAGMAAGVAGIAAAGAGAGAAFEDALSLDELDVTGAANDAVDEVDLSAVADDLTLDLDQLSGDMELDGTELLDAGTGDLELADLTSDNNLAASGLVASGDGENADEMDTMMDLAKAYIDMGDKDSASSALGEIVKAGSPEQVTEAETLLRKIS